MSNGVDNNRKMAVCESCGNAYAARETGDGALVPIGNRNGCSCGGSSFSEVAVETDLDFDEEG